MDRVLMESTEPVSRSADPRAAFAELSQIMFSAQPLSDTLRRIAELAKQTIPNAAEVSVTLLQDSNVSTVAFTGPLASQLDERQYTAGFGPCMDAALSGGGVIAIDDTTADSRYPDFGRIAARTGITHTMSIGLPVEQRTIGALNIYGVENGPFDDATQEIGEAFASYAAVAVANAGLYASTAALAANLQRALDSRAVIEQAKGVLMARHGCSAATAFDLLTHESNTSNRKLRDIARDIVAGVHAEPDA
jgi:GAF domain-containing protein